MSIVVRTAIARIAVPMLVLFAVGCGSGFGDVTGKVTYKQRALDSGTVMILASDGQPYDSAIDSAGNYVIRKVPAGHAKIAVTSIVPIANKEPKETKDGKKTESRLVAIEVTKGTTPSRISAIPTRYGTFAASNLAVDVVSGRTTHNIELGD
jgi:hypothetical protein